MAAKRTLAVVLLALCSPTPVVADEIAGLIGFWAGNEPGVAPASSTPASSDPSPRERRLAMKLAARLNRAATSTKRVHYPARLVGSEELPAAKGVRVSLEGGVVVERLAFSDRQAALRYALYAAGEERRHTLIETRGQQVLVLRGQALENPRFAARARRAGWEGLNAPQGGPEALGAFLEPGETILSLARPEPNFESHFGAALAEAREKLGSQGVSQTGPNSFRIEQPEVHAELEADGEARRLWVTPQPARAPHLRSYQRILEQESARLDRASPRKARKHKRDGGQSGGYIQLGILPRGSVPGFAGLLGPAGHFGQVNTGGVLGIQPRGTRPITVTPGEVEARQHAARRRSEPRRTTTRGAIGGLDSLFD